MIRFSIATQRTVRGAGFGNELIPWGKSILGARIFSSSCLEPAWALNKYSIGNDLEMSQKRMLLSNLLASSPISVRISDDEYRQTQEADYGAALDVIRENDPRISQALVTTHSGMSGGYFGIKSAREEISQRISGTNSAQSVREIMNSLKQTSTVIGIHVRLGDFQPRAISSGIFNTSIPLTWFQSLINLFNERFDGNLIFVIFSDGDPSKFLHSKNGILMSSNQAFGGRTNQISDLYALSLCDLIVCSISSFSLASAFLSDSPYIWHGDQLSENSKGQRGIWCHEETQKVTGSPSIVSSEQLTARQISKHSSNEKPRGIPFSESIQLPDWLNSEFLGSDNINFPIWNDLLYYGLVSV